MKTKVQLDMNTNLRGNLKYVIKLLTAQQTFCTSFER